MATPKNLIISEQDRLASDIADTDFRVAGLSIEEKLDRKAVALEKARAALVEAQRQDEHSHSWDEHFDALGR